MTSIRQDTPYIRKRVQEEADGWPTELHPDVIAALAEYAETGDPRRLDITIFKAIRNAIAAGKR